MRVNRSHTGNRRSHHALKEPRLSTCGKCGSKHLRHRMCPECGNYRDREVVDIVGKKADRMKRREEKLASMGVDVHADDEVEETKTEKKETKEATKKKTEAKKETTTKTAKKKVAEKKEK